MSGTAAAVLMLASYRNQCVHVFVRPAILATAIRTSRATRRGGMTDHRPVPLNGFEGMNMPLPSLFTEELFNYFFFLQDIFSNEFIFVPGKSSQVVVSLFFSGR